jgi:hypothetical protein
MRWPGDWRHDYANLGLGGGNVLLLLIGYHLPTRAGWQVSLVLVGVTSLWAWYANLKRYRTVADTPTSRIASAPQGYVEIVGRGKQPPGAKLLSPISGLPCLWYRYRVEHHNGDRWEQIDSATSYETFGVDDGSGQILVDPEGAEIITSRKQVSTAGGYRNTEWTLIEGETVYVIGEHVTLGGANATLDKKTDVADLLSEWKRDQATLRARFDADRNGEISLEEWGRARETAAAEVDRNHLEIRLTDGVHLLQKPLHGRPFLIANRNVAALVRHFRLWSLGHLVLMTVALLGLALIAP